MKKYNIVLGLFVSVFILLGSVFAFMPQQANATGVWTQQVGAGLHPWTAVASSSDGTKLVAVVGGPGGNTQGYIYTSIDSGVTWTQRTSAGLRHWRSVASSPDGNEIAVGVCDYGANNNYIYTSENGGVTWTEQTGGLPGSGCWSSITSSFKTQNNQQFIILNAVDENSGYTYGSINGGFFGWEKRSISGPRQWTAIATSSDAGKLVAAPLSGFIYTALGMGIPWTERTSAGSHQWTSIASSSDGNKLVATSHQGTQGFIYTSTDSGATWTQRNSAGAYQWWSVASSSDGVKLVAVAKSGYIYISTDSGVTWIQQTSAGLRNWNSVASSFDGSKLVAVVTGNNYENGYVYTYTDSQSSNVPTLTTQGATAITQIGATLNGNLTATGGANATTRGFNYGLTTSYGTTTTETGTFNTGAFSKNITGLTCGTTYHYRSYATNTAGTGYGNDITFITSACSQSGGTWVERTSAGLHPWTAVASSSDGTKLVAVVGGPGGNTQGYIYTSIDSGVTWTQRTSAGLRHWRSVASSPDGNEIAVGVCDYGANDNYIYISLDGGVTWTQSTPSVSSCWASIAIAPGISTKGTQYFDFHIVADHNNGYTYSATYFMGDPIIFLWDKIQNSGPRQWTAIAASTSGDKFVALPVNGYIYTTLGGFPWTERTSAGIHQWTSVASSADGLKLIAASIQGTYGYLYTSVDSGVSWTQRNSAGSHEWVSVASSSDGTKLVAAVLSGYIYTSTDSGLTWVQQTSAGSRGWYSVASSSDGTKLVAVDQNGGYIYTYTDSQSSNVPTLTTQGATAITQIGATLNGNLTATGGANATTRGFNYGLTTSYGTTTTETGSFNTGAFSKNITGLTCGKTYHYQSYATNSNGTGNGDDMTFNTSVCNVVVKTPPVSNSTTNNTSSVEGITPNSGTPSTSAPTNTSTPTNTITPTVAPTKPAPTTTTPTVSTPTKVVPSVPTTQTPTPTPTKTNTPTVTPTKPTVSVEGSALSSNALNAFDSANTKTTETPTVQPTAPRILKVTMTGDDVKVLQIYLNTHGYTIAKVGPGSLNNETTYFGTKTESALVAFQKANGLAPDGVAGLDTLAKMK